MALDLPIADARARVATELSGVQDEVLALSRNVHANPETSFEEHRAAAWTAELLDRHGFAVARPFGGLETALEARWSGRPGGAVIALLGEYDALPEIGHGCGHNLMCSSSAGAAIAAARVAGRDFDGEIRFIGTPAEEAGNGKVYLIEAGAFKDVDVALQMHPGNETKVDVRALALQEVGLIFHGTAAHAAADPWNGHNALDALIAFFNLVSQWRQHLRPGERVHGIVTHGGAAPNIIPDETAAEFIVRSPIDHRLDELLARFTTIAESAAASAGCTVEVRHSRYGRSRTMRSNSVLVEVFRRNLEAVGWVDEGVRPPGGSTDMGDVSHEVPTIHPHMAVAPAGTPGHSRQFSALAGGPDGERALLAAAHSLARTVLDLLADPGLVAAALAEFRRGEGG